MWKSKKFIIISIVAAVVVLAGATAGIAFAADEQPANPDNGQVKLLARVAEILGIDQDKLESAFKQAAKEMAEQRLDQYLDKQVQDGNLTQDQADQYKQWLEAKPDIPLPGGSDGFFQKRFPFKQGLMHRSAVGSGM